jgi:hypothetical protein
MPGVRYGPDISDDAAYIYKGIVSLQKKEQALKRKAQAAKKAGKKVKGGTLNARDKAQYERFANMASDIFGVTKRDLKAGRFGDLYTLQQYSRDGVTKKGKQSKKYKVAKNKRTGKMKIKRDTKESLDRSEGKVTRRAGMGSSYIGATAPKAYRDASDRAFKRMKQRGGVRTGSGKRKKVTNAEGLDNLQIAKRPKPVGLLTGGGVKIRPQVLRPKKVKAPRAAASSKRAKTTQSKTKSTVKAAGKTPKRKTTRKK